MKCVVFLLLCGFFSRAEIAFSLVYKILVIVSNVYVLIFLPIVMGAINSGRPFIVVVAYLCLCLLVLTDQGD